MNRATGPQAGDNPVRTATPGALAYVGLGANLGDAAAAVRAAAHELQRTPGTRMLRLSPLYRSAPVESGGPDYVNAVAAIQTDLAPRALLEALFAIERAHGRERPYRNAPRTLDLDLLWYDGRHLDEPGLIVPHPRMHERAFVLCPLMDLAPALVLDQGTLPELLARCTAQAIRRADDDADIRPRRTLTRTEDDEDGMDAKPATPAAPSTPLVQLVVAYTDERVIGLRGAMPWHLPMDLAHFKRTTLGQPVLMGRKTWAALQRRPLPGRRNLVLSRDAGFVPQGAERYASLEAALAACADAGRVCVIGGEQIFRLALPYAGEVIATEIHAHVEGDTWFPALSPAEWRECERLPQPPENGLAYDFVTYRRR